VEWPLLFRHSSLCLALSRPSVNSLFSLIQSERASIIIDSYTILISVSASRSAPAIL